MRRLLLTGLATVLAAAAACADDATSVVDEKAGTVSLPAKTAEQGKYEVLKGSIEYLLVARGGKAYETVFVTECSAQDVSQALLKAGARPGRPAADGEAPSGTPVRIFVEYTADGNPVRRSADEFILHKKTGKPLEPREWTFTGSRRVFDPATEKEALEASVTKSLVGLHRGDASPLVQNAREESKEENIYAANTKELPKPGTEVRIVFEVVRTAAPAGVRRAHVFVSGRVQGVAFRMFVQREALQLELKGWVKNLADGRVEAVVEGPPDRIDTLLGKLRTGPRTAKVEKVDAADEPATGEFQTFEIRYE